MKSLLLVGGFGFVGKNLIRLLKKDYQITVLSRAIDEDFIILNSDVRYIKAELEDENSVFNALSNNDWDYVINLVSKVTAERDLTQFKTQLSSNVLVLLNLYKALQPKKILKLFVQVGSLEEYGNIEVPFNEDMRENPDSPYALSKQLATNTALMLNRNYKFPAAVIRLANVFGPHQPAGKLIPYVVGKLKANEELRMSPGNQERDFISVDDVCITLDRLLAVHDKIQGQIINLCSGKGITIRTVVSHLKVYLGSTSTIEWGALPYRENEMMSFQGSTKKLEELVGTEVNFEALAMMEKYISEGLI